MSLVYHKISSKKQYGGNIDAHNRQMWLMTKVFKVERSETAETEDLTLSAGIKKY